MLNCHHFRYQWHITNKKNQDGKKHKEATIALSQIQGNSPKMGDSQAIANLTNGIKKTKDQKVLNNWGISRVSPTLLLKCVRWFCSRLYFSFLHYRETQCGGLGNIPFYSHACSLCCHEPDVSAMGSVISSLVLGWQNSV